MILWLKNHIGKSKRIDLLEFLKLITGNLKAEFQWL